MKKQIPSLNGLRALSIFLVLYAHGYISVVTFLQHVFSHISPSIADKLAHTIQTAEIPGGQIGVNIFFVISGYLITLLLVKEEKANGFVSLKLFYIRRTIRIFPVYYFLLLVYFLFQLIGLFSFSSDSWIRSLTYSKDFPLAKGSDWETGHLWSLSVEEHFYLLWPLIFKFLKKNKMTFAILVIVASTTVRLFTDTTHMHLFTRADALMWGCIFGLYNEKIIAFLNGIYAKNKYFVVLPFIVMLLAIASKKIFSLLGLYNTEHIVEAFLGSFGMITDISIAFAIIISINFESNLWFKLLNSPFLEYIGKLSYSIYLWQQIFFSDKVGNLNTFPLNLLMIFVVANLSFYVVEKPLLSLRTKFKAKGV